LTADNEPGSKWPQTLWFSGEDRLKTEAPEGRYWVAIAAVDSEGMTGRAFTLVDVSMTAPRSDLESAAGEAMAARAEAKG
jgi:hypothetical protein